MRASPFWNTVLGFVHIALLFHSGFGQTNTPSRAPTLVGPQLLVQRLPRRPAVRLRVLLQPPRSRHAVPLGAQLPLQGAQVVLGGRGPVCDFLSWGSR